MNPCRLIRKTQLYRKMTIVCKQFIEELQVANKDLKTFLGCFLRNMDFENKVISLL